MKKTHGAWSKYLDNKSVGENEKLLDYIIQHMDRRFEDLNERVTDLESKLNALLHFKWQMVSGAAVISALVTAGLQIASLYLSY